MWRDERRRRFFLLAMRGYLVAHPRFDEAERYDPGARRALEEARQAG